MSWRIVLKNTHQRPPTCEITNKKSRVDPSAAPPIIVSMLDKTSRKNIHCSQFFKEGLNHLFEKLLIVKKKNYYKDLIISLC